MICPCHSKKLYSLCCEPFHKGISLPKTALELMRSRYSAYAKGLIHYLIQTTHPSNPLFKKSQSKIEADLLQFCHTTNFTGLDILSFQNGETEAFVHFKAHLTQSGNDCSFEEKSRFVKTAGKWLYHSDEVSDTSI